MGGKPSTPEYTLELGDVQNLYPGFVAQRRENYLMHKSRKTTLERRMSSAGLDSESEAYQGEIAKEQERFREAQMDQYGKGLGKDLKKWFKDPKGGSQYLAFADYATEEDQSDFKARYGRDAKSWEMASEFMFNDPERYKEIKKETKRGNIYVMAGEGEERGPTWMNRDEAIGQTVAGYQAAREGGENYKSIYEYNEAQKDSGTYLSQSHISKYMSDELTKNMREMTF